MQVKHENELAEGIIFNDTRVSKLVPFKNVFRSWTSRLNKFGLAAY